MIMIHMYIGKEAETFFNTNFTQNLCELIFCYSIQFNVLQIYEAWETDKIISVELWRNLSLCLIAVATISLALLGDFRYVAHNVSVTFPSYFNLFQPFVT